MNLIILFNLSLVCRNIQRQQLFWWLFYIHTFTYCANRAQCKSLIACLWQISSSSPESCLTREAEHFQPSPVENRNRNGWNGWISQTLREKIWRIWDLKLKIENRQREICCCCCSCYFWCSVLNILTFCTYIYVSCRCIYNAIFLWLCMSLDWYNTLFWQRNRQMVCLTSTDGAKLLT